MNLYQLFHDTAHKQPEHLAILGPRAESTTYGELDAAIRQTSDDLGRAGVTAGSCVGLHCSSGREYIILNYAVWRLGGCVVPIPIELTEPEKQEICRTICMDFVVSEKRALGFVKPFQKDGETDLSPRSLVMAIASPREHPAGFSDVNAAFIRFTSGTTGASKGVVLSHETVRDRILAANDALHIGPQDRVVWLLSMSYHFTVSIVGYLTFGATIVLPLNHFAEAVLKATVQHQGTLIYASPVHYAWMAKSPSAPDLSRLRLAVSTTTALDAATAESFYNRFGIPLTQALGVIEIGLPCINIDFAREHSAAIGRVLPAYRLRMEDVGLGDNLREIVFAGKGFLDAYYDPWRPRRQIMPDGWFHTGDVGELTADGCLFIRGRIKEVISVAGMKFFPQEVEQVLLSHPQVRDACVFSQRDARLGEVPCARVVFKDGAECTESELLDYCKRRLAAYKLPQRIEFADNLRRTASGKVVRVER